MAMLTKDNVSDGVAVKTTNYWRRSQFLLGGIFGLILFAATIFLVVQLIGQ